MIKKVLTIAGSDSSGGAGIQADLKTFCAHGVYGMTVITALTAQNTKGVYLAEVTTPGMIKAQLKAVFEDIQPDAVKIGMLPAGESVKIIAGLLKEYNAVNIVLDPVMVSTSGYSLTMNDTTESMIKYLFPLAEIITPNIPEAEVLTGKRISGEKDIIDALKEIKKMTPGSVLIKGGHGEGKDSSDYLLSGDEISIFKAERIDTINSHGTGCTLSSSMASNLALGKSIPEAVKRSKDYITEALMNDPKIGNGNGPLDHMYKTRVDNNIK